MKNKLVTGDGKKANAILRAATKLFLKHGYSITTMDGIAAAARVTKQTVYAHYQSKEQLFTLMIASLCQKHAPAETVPANSTTSFEALLLDIGLHLLDLITSAEVLGATRLVIAESERHPKLAQLYYDSGTQQLVEMVADFLSQQNARGLSTIPNPPSASSYFLSLLKGQYYLRMILRVKPVPSQQEKEEHVREVVKIFMHVYGGKSPLKTVSTL